MERSDQKQVKLKSRTKSVIIAHTHRSCNKMQQLIYLVNFIYGGNSIGFLEENVNLLMYSDVIQVL